MLRKDGIFTVDPGSRPLQEKRNVSVLICPNPMWTQAGTVGSGPESQEEVHDESWSIDLADQPPMAGPLPELV
jgi:hypothetical protein